MGPAASPREQEPEADAALLTPLGEFMQRRNAELGLSIAAVSQRVGMSRATWYRIARGESASPGVRVLRGLARVYKVRAAELFALAEHAHAPPVPPRSPAPAPAREPGDALWRCRHERRVRAGAWVEVQVDLLNLSEQTWRHAEVRGTSDAWFLIGGRVEGAELAADAVHAVHGTGARLSCRVELPATAPNEWARTRIALQAPLAAGICLFGLGLHLERTAAPVGGGAFVRVETI